MRRSILLCSFGLLCVSWLAGCGFIRSFRDDCCGKKKSCATGCESPKAAPKAEPKAMPKTLPSAAKSTNSSAYARLSERVRSALTPTRKIAKGKGKAKESPLQNAKSTPIEPLTMPPRILPEAVNDTPEPGPISPSVQHAVEPPVASPQPEVPVRSAANITDEPPNRAPLAPAIKTVKTAEIIGESAKTGEKNIAIQKTEITYGREPGFRSVTGQVHLFRKTWRLRYADVAQEDIYGGTVVLDGGTELSKLQSGRHVRVRGTLIPPTERYGSAHYRVDAIEILD